MSFKVGPKSPKVVFNIKPPESAEAVSALEEWIRKTLGSSYGGDWTYLTFGMRGVFFFKNEQDALMLVLKSSSTGAILESTNICLPNLE